MDELSGRVALVTGGSRGIGLGMANAFIKEGASVVITGRTQHTLDTALARLLSNDHSDGGALAIRADGRDEDDVTNAVWSTIDHFGRLDVLVNCAQVVINDVPFEELTMDDMRTSYETGVFATFLYMKHCFPNLQETKGTIINFTSTSGLKSSPGSAAYGPNKEAIRGLSRTAANEWAKDRITVNTINPLVIFEEMMAENPDKFSAILNSIPLGRNGDAESDCGELGVFLATRGKFMTGMNFGVDGGRSVMS